MDIADDPIPESGNEIGSRSQVASIMGGDNRIGETAALGAALVVSAKCAKVTSHAVKQAKAGIVGTIYTVMLEKARNSPWWRRP